MKASAGPLIPGDLAATRGQAEDGKASGRGRETRYRLDREDVLRSVSGSWDDFARENDAPHLSGVAVVGRSIWDFIAGEEVRHLSGLLFSAVREEERPVTVPFRCDAPGIRRWMTLTIEPVSASGGGLDITVRSVGEESRTPARVLDVHARRTGATLRVCAWCKRARLGEDDWSEIEEAVERYGLFGSEKVPTISHGICPECRERVEGEIAAS